jgi:hypothetical protein
LQVRGFNLQYKGIIYQVIDENTDKIIVYETYDDVRVNFDERMTIIPGDVVTVCNMKHLGEFPYDYIQNPIYLNCEPQNFYCGGWSNGNDLGGSVAIGFGYDKKTNDTKNHIYSGFVNFGGKEMQYDIKDGSLALHEWDQVTTGYVGVSLPLSSEDVQQHVDNGDYELFTKKGVVYVKIGNNLSLRRYDKWTYMGLGDPVTMTALARIEVKIVFEILDWDEIIAPHEYITEYGNPRISAGQTLHGDGSDINDITTELMGCK